MRSRSKRPPLLRWVNCAARVTGQAYGFVLASCRLKPMLLTGVLMFTDIKPGPKPKREDGKDDRRRHVNPPNDKKHPTLPIHKHKPGD